METQEIRWVVEDLGNFILEQDGTTAQVQVQGFETGPQEWVSYELFAGGLTPGICSQERLDVFTKWLQDRNAVEFTENG